ncbi:MAG: hypothetical protein JWR69_3686 [Pedosphaera sp.]|nr:hypothetical protein [Pedosphaera sp.]
MHESKYFKAACDLCGAHIEFPDTAVGRMVNCPHCGEQTQLRSITKPGLPDAVPPVAAEVQADSPLPPRKASNVGLIAGLVCVVLALSAVGIFLIKRTSPNPVVNATVEKPGDARTNSPALTNQPAPTVAAAPKAPKSSSDLKVGDIQLEKAKGSSLVYVVGTLNNDSDYQRFGIRIQLDLLNGEEAKLGTAQDYKDILEPRKSWKFRALVTDSKAVSAKLALIHEDD